MEFLPDGSVVEKPKASDLDAANPPEWLECCSEFLAVRRAIEDHGVQGWMALHDVEPHPVLPEALDVFENELQRLRHETSVERMKTERAKAKRQKR
ncbi:MAG: hypothetical protein NCW75_05535 [Phycisphaera sp.]|nr:MAG: hypothetical protein NCW75_05535 [Phycisphaera sp.]